MKKILIAIDYDPSALKVAEVGFELAKCMDAEVLMLHVISDPEDYRSAEHVNIIGFAGQKAIAPLLMDNDQGLIKIAHIFLDRMYEKIGYKHTKTLVELGDCAESILRISKEMQVDLVIVGSHSRKKNENVVLGSIAEKVLLQTMIPIFIVPTRKQG